MPFFEDSGCCPKILDYNLRKIPIEGGDCKGGWRVGCHKRNEGVFSGVVELKETKFKTLLSKKTIFFIGKTIS